MAIRRRREYIDEPPDYRRSNDRYPGEDGRPGGRKPNRRLRTAPAMRPSMRGARPQGGPFGRLTNRQQRREATDRHGEWAPGEFQRSYPKNKKNAEWYRTHTYGRSVGNDYDSWRRIAGPPTPKGYPKQKKEPGNWHAPKPKPKPKIPGWIREAGKKKRGNR